jgi:hypothetical protein
VGLDYLFCFWLVGLADLICLVPVFILDLLTVGIFVVCTASMGKRKVRVLENSVVKV